MPTKIEISHKTIFFLAVFILLIWTVIQIWDILALLFVSFVLMSGLRPMVDRLEKIYIPRPLAIIILYILLFSIVGFASSILLPPIISETSNFISQLPTYINQLFAYLDGAMPFFRVDIQNLLPQIAPFGQNVARITFGVFTNVIALFTLLVFTFYLLLERKNLGAFLREAVGTDTAHRIIGVILHIEEQIGGWIRGQLALMTIVGVAVYVGLTLLQIPFALPLAVIAGLLEVIPNIGPTISSIPSIIVAFTVSFNPLLAVAVGALYFIINQLENTLIVPFVMRHAVGLPPLVTITALLVGGRLAGLFGVLFAVPIILISKTLVQEFVLKKTRNG